MSRFRWVATGILLALAVTVTAQETKKPDRSQNAAQQQAPTFETLMKTLTEKLDLTADQQTKIKAILQDLHEFTRKVAEDKSLTDEERKAKAKPERMKAHQQMMALLTDEQKKKAEDYLKGQHPEMHQELK